MPDLYRNWRLAMLTAAFTAAGIILVFLLGSLLLALQQMFANGFA